MLTLLLACLCIAAWGFNSVAAELTKQHPREPPNSLQTRSAVDDFIWSEEAPRALRRRYALSMACVPIGLLCLAQLIWTNEPTPDRRLAAVTITSLIALTLAVILIRKVVRHGI